MNRIFMIVMILLVLFGFTAAQTPEPSNMPADFSEFKDWIKTGQFVFTYKTSMGMSNGEAMANSTDGDIFFTFDDDAATLADFIIRSSNDSANVADNDLMNLMFRWYDDSLGWTDWVVFEAKATDVSDDSEDSQVSFKTYAAGSQVTPLVLSGTAATFAGDVTQSAGKMNASSADSVALGSSSYIHQVGRTTYGDSLFIVVYAKNAGKDTVWLPLN
jgi:hypothetical protein